MTVLSIHDNEEFRILTQVDHSKSVKHMPLLDFFENFDNLKFKFYLSFQFFKYFTPTKTSEPQLGCEDLEYLTVKVEQNRKLAIWVWFMLDHVQAPKSLRTRKPVIYWFFEPETVLTNL